MPICLNFPEFKSERHIVSVICRERGLPPPKYVFPAPELVYQIEHCLKILSEIERSTMPPVVRRRCRYFVEEYMIPELENFMSLAKAIAATPVGSPDEARILQKFGITVEWGLIRRCTSAKPLSRSDRDFLSSMNVSW